MKTGPQKRQKTIDAKKGCQLTKIYCVEKWNGAYIVSNWRVQ